MNRCSVLTMCLALSACGAKNEPVGVSAMTHDDRGVEASPSESNQSQVAVDAGPDDARPDDARPGDARPDDARPDDARPDDARPIDAGPDDARPDDAGPDDVGPDDVGLGTLPDEADASEAVAMLDAQQPPAIECTRRDGPPRGGADWALFKHDVEARSCLQLNFELGVCVGLALRDGDICLNWATLWEGTDQCPPTERLAPLRAVEASGNLGAGDQDVSVDLRFEVEAGVRDMHVDFEDCDTFTHLPG